MIAGLLTKAASEHRAGRLDAAKQLCLQILAIDVRQADTLNMLGMLEHQAGRPEVAARMLQRAIAADAENPAHYANLGVVLQVLGKQDEAEAQYALALRLKPDHAEALYNFAILLWKTRRLEGARAALAQLVKLKPDDWSAHNALGAVLREMDQLDDAKAHIKRALALNPESVEARSNLGAVLRDEGRLDEARGCLEQAVALGPDHFDALNNLGTVLRRFGRLEEARLALEKALSLAPRSADALSNLGNVLADKGKLNDAVLCYERAIALHPNRSESYNNLGNALRDLGKPRDGLLCYERALTLQPEYADAHWNRSLVQLLLGNFSEGWRNYEWRNRRRKGGGRGFSQSQWHGEPLAAKRILLHAEQGLGDALQFLRYAPMVQAAGGAVLLEVPACLRTLAEEMPGVTGVIVKGDPLPEFDCHCPLMSLPLAFDTTLETIPAKMPYLSIPHRAKEKAEARAWPEDGVRVGLVWCGSPVNSRDRWRSIPLALFESLFALPNVRFFSLQVGSGSEQLSTMAVPITDLTATIEDMADTAALITHLDLILTVDTSVAHLAGALGRPVWVPLPFANDWRWLQDREDSPWYPSMRLFRQAEPGDWKSVIERVRTSLATLAKGDSTVLAPSRALAFKREQQLAIAELRTRTTEEGRRRGVIDAGGTDVARWADASQLEAAWDVRAQRAADYIPAGATVLDLGCGRMALERFLPHECRYIPCDLVARDPRTVVCDFNAGQFPDAQAASADVVNLLGVLEYIYDPRAFLKHLRYWKRPVVMSYCATEAIGDRGQRRGLGWVNDLSLHELNNLFAHAGFAVQRADRIDKVQWIFRLLPDSPIMPPTKRVGVLSFYTAGNFGDRLGYHLINEILPAHAEVTHLSLKNPIPSHMAFDLLIVGMGNSLFGTHLDDSLLSLIDHSEAAIGIFGTQYHESLPKTTLREVLHRLHHWYARYEDDLFRYGRGLDNASHLGDWLITAFPMSRGTDAQPLTIGKEIWNDLPLDRTIQEIQRHTTVFSERIHPLLCALTSAEKAGYREQRENGAAMISGKFRAMLIDIFGRTFPEDTFFDVDRSQVLRYKSEVETHVRLLRDDIHRLLHAPIAAQ